MQHRQRQVLIAATFIADPPIMVLDEPALGLDMEEEQRVNAWLRELAQQGNPVMLSAAKHLHAHPDRPFAALRVTRNGHPIQRHALYPLASTQRSKSKR